MDVRCPHTCYDKKIAALRICIDTKGPPLVLSFPYYFPQKCFPPKAIAIDPTGLTHQYTAHFSHYIPGCFSYILPIFHGYDLFQHCSNFAHIVTGAHCPSGIASGSCNQAYSGFLRHKHLGRSSSVQVHSVLLQLNMSFTFRTEYE